MEKNRWTALVGASILLVSSSALGDGVSGKITAIQVTSGAPGTVQVRVAGAEAKAAGVNDELAAGSEVSTAKGQTVFIKLTDDSEIVVAPQSTMAIEPLKAPTDSPALTLLLGLLHASVSKIYSSENPFTVSTRSSVMGVRGTEFVVETDRGGRTTLSTVDGKVAFARTAAELRNPGASRLVEPGHTSSFGPGLKIPSEPRKFNRKTMADYLGRVSPALEKHVQTLHLARVARQSSSHRAGQGGKKGEKEKDKDKEPKHAPVFKPQKPKRHRGH